MEEAGLRQSRSQERSCFKAKVRYQVRTGASVVRWIAIVIHRRAGSDSLFKRPR